MTTALDLQEGSPTRTQAGIGRRVLTLSADMGGGHNATANALEETIAALWPGSEVRRLDTLDILGPGIGRLFRSIYVTNVEDTPWLYEFFYSSLWRHRWFADASKRFVGSWCGRRLATQVDRFDPDLIVSTYPLGSAGLAWLRRHRGLAVPMGAWVSDFAPHPFWVYRDLDLNLVMHDVSVPVAQAAEPGLRTQVCAPPVVSAFSPGDRRRAREKLGLRPEAFVVLVSCGAYAFGDVAGTVRTLTEASPDVQVVAACGRNETTYHHLQELGIPRRSLVPMGWTDAMADLVRASDLVVTNAGGATALEALACGTPILMSAPIAAHGAANADLMVVSGLAEISLAPDQLTQYVRAAVRDPASLESMRTRSRDHLRSHDLATGLVDLATKSRPAARVTRPWPMRPADAFFTHVETAELRQELGAVLQLQPLAPGRSVSRADLVARMQDCAVLPSTRRRLVRRPRPAWRLQDTNIAQDHVEERVVPADATDADVFDVVSDFWSETMPPDRPGWHMILVRGQASGRSVMAVKLHHSQGDGVSALGLLDRLLDTAPDDDLADRQGAPAPEAAADRPATRRTDALRAAGTLGWRLVRGLASLARNGTAPRHAVNHPIRNLRRRLTFIPIPADRMRQVARAHDARPYELMLAVAADTFRTLLVPTGLMDQRRPFRVMVPVATRAPRLDRTFANWTGSVSLDLPVGDMTPADRLRSVREEIRRRVDRGEPHAGQLVLHVAGMLPSRLHALVARSIYTRRFFNSIVSYMPGARAPRWCAGARVEAMYPVLPLADGVPLTVGILVAGDTAGVGVVTDGDLPLERSEITHAVRSAFDAFDRDGPA